MVIRPVDLGVLCRLLRAAGLPVTAVHELRLQTVFRTFEDVPADRVLRLVAPVVMSAPEDLAIIEEVVARWLPDVNAPRFFETTGQHVIERPAGQANPVHQAAEAYTAAPGRRFGWLVAVALGLAALGGLALLALPDDGPGEPPRDAGGPIDASLISETAPAPRADRPRGTYPGATITYQPASRPGIVLFSLIFLGGLGGGLALYFIRRRRPGLPSELPPPASGGVAPPRRPTPVPELTRLTDVADQNALVWGVDHFLSESTGSRIDLAESVRATARAGERPVVVWAHERKARAIWLWIDADAETNAVERLAEEIRGTLVANGLEVHVAWFAGLPDRLYLGREVILPEDLPTPPQEAVVAVLTDGLSLLRIESGLVGVALRALRSWPRLAMVDFAHGATDLPLRMRPYGIEVIEPEAMARWLGGEAAAGVSVREVDLTPWLCALALSPTPVDPADALALGARLGVDHPARHLTAIEQEARVVGGRLTWPWADRAVRLDWLVRQRDLLEIALDFWKSRHAPGAGDTALDRARAVERAWLTLFTQPTEAAPLLFSEPSQRGWIEENLRGLDVADAPPGAGRVRLPWTWADVPPLTRVMLQARGFAGEIVAPVQPGRPWAAIAGCAAAMAVGLVGFLWPWEPGAPEVTLGAGTPWGAEIMGVEPGADGLYRVKIRTIQDGEEVLGGTPVPAGAAAEVVWNGAARDCARTDDARHLLEKAAHLADGLERWFCTENGLVTPFEEREWHVVIGATPDTPGASALARRLLDLGVAIEVIFDPSLGGQGYHRGDEEMGMAYLSRSYVALSNGLPCDTPRLGLFGLCVPDADLQSLAEALGGDPRPLLEVWPRATGRLARTGRLPGLDPVLRISLEIQANPEAIDALDCGRQDLCALVANLLAVGGRGVAADGALAARVRQRACDAGQMRGCNDLGFQYTAGKKGLPRDYGAAARLYRQACEGGYGLACSNLGTFQLPGNEGNAAVGGANVDTAIELFRRACDAVCPPGTSSGCQSGQSGGCTHLGRLYRDGKHVPRDEARAAAYFQRGCDAGNAAACKALSAAPGSMAPGTVAPPTVAPPTVAPPTVAPPTVAPTAITAPKVEVVRGRFVRDLVLTFDYIADFKAGAPQLTPSGVMVSFTGTPVPPRWTTRADLGDRQATVRGAGDGIRVDLSGEPPANALLPVLRPVRRGATVRIRVPMVLPEEMAALLAEVPRQIDAQASAARQAGRSVSEACLVRFHVAATEKIWKALRNLYEQDSDQAPEVRAIVAEPLDRAALDACLGPAVDAELTEARASLAVEVAAIRATLEGGYASGERCRVPRAEAERQLDAPLPADAESTRNRAARLQALVTELFTCAQADVQQRPPPPEEVQEAVERERLEKSLDAVRKNVAARRAHADLLSAPCLNEAERRLDAVAVVLKGSRIRIGDRAAVARERAAALVAAEQEVWNTLETLKKCVGEDGSLKGPADAPPNRPLMPGTDARRSIPRPGDSTR